MESRTDNERRKGREFNREIKGGNSSEKERDIKSYRMSGGEGEIEKKRGREEKKITMEGKELNTPCVCICACCVLRTTHLKSFFSLSFVNSLPRSVPLSTSQFLLHGLI